MLKLFADNKDSLHLVYIMHLKNCYYRHTINVTGSFARTNAYFGRGTAPILLDNVACRGTESRLIDCTYSSHTSDCNHGEDAGVTCQPANYNSP